MECLKMISVRHGDAVHRVPCGRCAFCLVNKRSSWMFRIHHEMRAQNYPGWFLTFTYDERHVKRVADGRLSLRFRDIQLFIKRLRKAKHYVKYVCVGEYGSETSRPHYHMLLWTSADTEFIQAQWKSSKDNTPLGRVHFGRISMRSAMYTLKYIIQPKQRRVDGIEATRAQFSKGLGLGYLTESVYNYHTKDYDDPVLFTVIDGRKVSLPRYYRLKIFTKYQLRREQHKSKWESIRRKRSTMRELLAKGICNTKEYMLKVRTDQCANILRSTKFNQTI